MEHPNDRKYSQDHEWVMIEGDLAVIGISEFAQDQLGEVVYVELPEEGNTFSVGEPFGEVESVKSVSELITPVSGEIIEVNQELIDAPETVNSDPHGDGWMVKVRMRNSGEYDSLMDAREYDAFLTEG